jgi:hypothetical protein
MIDNIKARIKGDHDEKYPGVRKINLCKKNDEIHLSHFTCTTLGYLLKINGFTIVKQGLDQHLGPKGFKLVKRLLLFGAFNSVYKIFKINRYETMFFIAKK